MLTSLASVYQSEGELALALPILERAIALSEATLGPKNPRLATSLNNLATLRGMGDGEAAARTLERSLALLEDTEGAEPLLLASVLHNLAYFLVARGDLERAEDACLRALRIQEASLGPDHEDVLDTVSRLAEVKALRDDHDSAGELFMRSVNGYVKRHGAASTEVAAEHEKVAALFERMEDLEEAFGEYELVAEVYKAAHKEPHADTARALQAMGRVRMEQERAEEAKPHFKGALAILHHLHGERHPAVIQILRDAAAAHAATDDHGLAERCCLQCVRSAEALYGKTDPRVLEHLWYLGGLYRDMKQLDKALTTTEGALVIGEAHSARRIPRSGSSRSSSATSTRRGRTSRGPTRPSAARSPFTRPISDRRSRSS